VRRVNDLARGARLRALPTLSGECHSMILFGRCSLQLVEDGRFVPLL